LARALPPRLEAALARVPEEFFAICGVFLVAWDAAGLWTFGLLASAGRFRAAGEALRS
jgi:hypothetical protein